AQAFLEASADDASRGGPEEGIARVPGDADVGGIQEIIAFHRGVIRWREETDVVDGHVFDAQAGTDAPGPSELVGDVEAPAFAGLGILVEKTLVKITAGGQGIGQIEQERFTEGGGIALQLRAGHGLDAQLLAGAAESPALPDVRQARGKTEQVEVLFV